MQSCWSHLHQYFTRRRPPDDKLKANTYVYLTTRIVQGLRAVYTRLVYAVRYNQLLQALQAQGLKIYALELTGMTYTATSASSLIVYRCIWHHSDDLPPMTLSVVHVAAAFCSFDRDQATLSQLRLHQLQLQRQLHVRRFMCLQPSSPRPTAWRLYKPLPQPPQAPPQPPQLPPSPPPTSQWIPGSLRSHPKKVEPCLEPELQGP